jgi:hypothetical protein
MRISRRTFGFGAALALAAWCLPVSALAASKSVAYYTVGQASTSAYLVDWKGHTRAHVANSTGAQSGVVEEKTTHRLVTLDAPISTTISPDDACGNIIFLRIDIQQLVVRDLPDRVSEIVEIGTKTNIGGCQDGLVTPFGAETDAGVAMKRQSMKSRPSMDDLVPGVQLAGPKEGLSQDVVTLGAGNALFHATGHSFASVMSDDHWLWIYMSDVDRAYARLEVDAKTLGETWMLAEWSDGKMLRAQSLTFVKPAAGAGFGSVAQTSRMWQSGQTINRSPTFFVHLFKNGTGETVLKYVDPDDEYRAPFDAWYFEGLDVVQMKMIGSRPSYRIWTPLRNEGKARWVLEKEIYSSGYRPPVLVNYYVDTGKALPVPPTSAR